MNEKELNFIERPIGIIFAPIKTFKYLINHPDWKVPPSLILIFLAITYLFMEESSLVEDMLSTKSKVGIATGIGLIFVVCCFTWGILSLFLYISGKIASVRISFSQSYTINGYAGTIPLIITSIAYCLPSALGITISFASLAYTAFLGILGIHSLTENTKKTVAITIIYAIFILMYAYLLSKI